MYQTFPCKFHMWRFVRCTIVPCTPLFDINWTFWPFFRRYFERFLKKLTIWRREALLFANRRLFYFAVWLLVRSGRGFRASINPLSPHDALKNHSTWLKTYLIFSQLRVLEGKFLLRIHSIFFWFITHIKSSSSTTSRELRQQFAACSGWRWQW